jgi:hypothetical protein
MGDCPASHVWLLEDKWANVGWRVIPPCNWIIVINLSPIHNHPTNQCTKFWCMALGLPYSKGYGGFLKSGYRKPLVFPLIIRFFDWFWGTPIVGNLHMNNNHVRLTLWRLWLLSPRNSYGLYPKMIILIHVNGNSRILKWRYCTT